VAILRCRSEEREAKVLAAEQIAIGEYPSSAGYIASGSNELSVAGFLSPSGFGSGWSAAVSVHRAANVSGGWSRTLAEPGPQFDFNRVGYFAAFTLRVRTAF
jgi:hypothetical protein